ncbi:unnamed protein product [Mytilus coruscus]|uniref:Apple domain-containing protein n=1 Tax=Mytilus coruscus TaxID=42192 RepID=A0A6J8CZC1_MYTCO|nr:unnamed protein product [Mytilus coruscus]
MDNIRLWETFNSIFESNKHDKCADQKFKLPYRTTFVVIPRLTTLTDFRYIIEKILHLFSETKMLQGKALCILAFNVVLLNSGVYALGFGGAGNVAGPVPGPVAAVVLPPMGDMNVGNPLAFLHMIISPLVETICIMVLNRTVFPLCSAMCGSSEEKHVTDLKCYTHRNDGMKGLDEYLIRAEHVKTFKQCEDQCEEYIYCWSFRYLPTTSFCFLYKSQQHIEDNIYESQFYVKHCTSCYMNATKNAKGRDDEIQTVWEVPCSKNVRIIVLSLTTAVLFISMEKDASNLTLKWNQRR